ncbi:MAG: TonB-dependent receptor [Sphingobium sp.]|nr:TonB-dependent receptor [Sphingobium sp.]
MPIHGRKTCAALLASCAITMPLHAQPAGASTMPEASSAQGDGLQDIVVTAQKRAENLQNVPISVTAVGGSTVQNLQITTLQGLYGKVPNIQLNNFSNTPNSAVITIRGIGVIEPDPYAGNTVSIVIDGVPQYFSMGALVDLYDVERIEILRGPQGTLFGANTTGGVVNIVTNQPSGTFGGKVETTYGNWKRFDIKGALDFPIVGDLLAGKVTVAHTQRDGYVTNAVDGSDMGSRNVTIYRGALKFTPSADFDATLGGEYVRARNGAPIVVNGAYPGEALYLASGTDGMYAGPCQSPSSRCKAPDKYRSARNADIPDDSDMNSYKVNLAANWRNTALGDLTSITAYKSFNLLEYTDQDGATASFFPARRYTKGRQFSQELRSAFDLADNINVVTGLFYLDTHYMHDQGNKLNFAAPGLFNRNLQDQDNHSVSGFAQAYYHPTDRLQVQGGIRYSYEKTSMLASSVTSISPTGATDFFGTGTNLISSVSPARATKSWRNVGWKLGADYEIADRTMIYASWARGFKSGGFVGRIGIPQDLGPFDPEKIDTFEGGIKADLLDRKVRLNLSAFYTNYRDMQIAQIYFTEIGGVPVQGNTILNAGSAHIKGFEFEATALPMAGLTLTGSLAYLNAKYADFPYTDPLTISPANPEGVETNLKGARLQNSPRWSATAAINYTLPLGDRGKAVFNLSYSYVAEKYFTAVLNTPRTTIQPTHLADGNVDFYPFNDKFSIGLWGRNLFDKRYLVSCYDSPGLTGFCGYAPPREYGVTSKISF